MRGRLRPGDVQPASGQHGFGAGAGHHHQGPGREAELQSAGRRGLRAEPDRYPRPCGLQLRGFPLPCRLRGSRSGGGLHPGRGGPDPCQHLSCHGAQFGNSACVQQNRPARHRPQEGQAGGGGHHRPARHGRAGDLGQNGH
ncbi:hypothetical protein SDC9_132987 [bioreactor metagenome]|uniref:Uncharacterized protein n=1 Tax=bioreactor metagenome TaxID=1076179 RepID=A0A645D9A9_9ZZZZ